MTNAEKYLQPNIDIEQFAKELHDFWWWNEYNITDSIIKFLESESEKANDKQR